MGLGFMWVRVVSTGQDDRTSHETSYAMGVPWTPFVRYLWRVPYVVEEAPGRTPVMG